MLQDTKTMGNVKPRPVHCQLSVVPGAFVDCSFSSGLNWCVKKLVT